MKVFLEKLFGLRNALEVLSSVTPFKVYNKRTFKI